MEMEEAVLWGSVNTARRGKCCSLLSDHCPGEGRVSRDTESLWDARFCPRCSCSSLAHMQFSDVASLAILYEMQNGPGWLVVLLPFVVKWLKYSDKRNVSDVGIVQFTVPASQPRMTGTWSDSPMAPTGEKRRQIVLLISLSPSSFIPGLSPWNGAAHIQSGNPTAVYQMKPCRHAHSAVYCRHFSLRHPSLMNIDQAS